MAVSNKTKRIVGEIAILIGLTYIWGVKSQVVSASRVKAGFLRQVVKAEPDNVEAYRFLADYYIESGRKKKGADALRQVVRIQPYNAHAWMMLGDTESDLGHHDAALAAYRKVANLHLDNAQAHYELGQAYLKIGEIDLALEEHKKLKKLDRQLAGELLDSIHSQR
jgi:tetratricopeptide (TPR) repeat protein